MTPARGEFHLNSIRQIMRLIRKCSTYYIYNKSPLPISHPALPDHQALELTPPWKLLSAPPPRSPLASSEIDRWRAEQWQLQQQQLPHILCSCAPSCPSLIILEFWGRTWAMAHRGGSSSRWPTHTLHTHSSWLIRDRSAHRQCYT